MPPFGRVSWMALLMLVACAPAGPAPGASGTGPLGAPEAQKTITVVALNPVRAFGSWSTSSTGGTFALNEIHSDALVTRSTDGDYEPRLLARLPSLDDGTLAVLPDGRMRITWHLRTDAKWHDGTPFTAADVVFTRQVLLNPDVPLSRSAEIDYIEHIDVLDQWTVVATLKAVYYLPNFLGLRHFWILPQHVLSEPFQGDKPAFSNLPYWTTDYIHLGPFHLVDYGMGENLIFERFDDYFLGRPKVNRIVVRIIPDENTVFANLLAGAVDIAPEQTLSPDLFVRLHEEWARTGEGTVVSRQGTWRFLGVQFNPEWGRPPELSRDVRVRRGLYQGFDRDALRETLLPGFSERTSPDSFMVQGDPLAPTVGRPFARYAFDPSTAALLLAEAGWRRAADGRMLNPAGEQVQIAIRTTPGYYKEGSIVAQYWRDLGIDVAEEQTPASLARDLEYGAKFPGFQANARASGGEIFKRFDSRDHATAQNRYTGSNSGYTNPTLDRLIDRLLSTIDEREQGLLLREMGGIIATDLPVLPTYFQVNLAAVRKGVRALIDDFAGATNPGLSSRNAYRWDRDIGGG